MAYICSVCVLLCSLVQGVLLIKLPDNTPVNEIRGYNKREHSLVKPYQGSGLGIPFWDLVGTTMVTNQYIRLTADLQSRQGALWNAVPCKSRDWEMIITFSVHGSKGDLFGDGLAFWYTKERGNLGPVFGNRDYFNGLGLLLDTYSNHNGPHNHGHPYISAMVSNGSLHYDHDRDGTHTELAGCEAKFRNKDYDTTLMIRYVNDEVSVYTDIHNKKVWDLCFSVPGVILPTGYFFGASAATGDLSDNHDIISIKMYELDFARPEKKDEVDRMNIVPQAQVFAAPRDHIPDVPPSKLGTLKTVFLVIVAVAFLGAFLAGGFLFLQKRQESSRKRFY